jgi:hypothetical protein
MVDSFHRDMTLKMIEKVDGHLLLKIQKELQEFMNWQPETFE